MTDLNKLLDHLEKAIEEAENLPAKLLRGLMYDMNIGPLEMSQYLTRWLDNPLNGVPKNGNDRSNRRGNLIKEISRPRITWNVFEKAVSLFDPVSFKVTVEMDMGLGKKFKRDVIVQLRDRAEYAKFMRGIHNDNFTPQPFNYDALPPANLEPPVVNNDYIERIQAVEPEPGVETHVLPTGKVNI